MRITISNDNDDYSPSTNRTRTLADDSSTTSTRTSFDFHNSFSTDDKQRLLIDHPQLLPDPALSVPVSVPVPGPISVPVHDRPVSIPVHDRPVSVPVHDREHDNLHKYSRQYVSTTVLEAKSEVSSDSSNSEYAFTQITPLNTIQYVHGGYSAAAPIFITNDKWMLILKHLMPEAHANLMSLLKGRPETMIRTTSNSPSKGSSMNDGMNGNRIRARSPSPSISNTGATGTTANTNSNASASATGGYNTSRIIKWAENNPIVTAYGCLYSKENQTKHQIEKSQLEQIKHNVQQSLNYNPTSSTIEHDNRTTKSRSYYNPNCSERTMSSPFFIHNDNVQQHSPKKRHFSNLTNHQHAQNTHNTHNPQKPIPAIEWDVFLDPTLVKHVDGAMQYLENLTKTNTLSGGVLVDHQTMENANTEVNKQVSRLLSRMVLAHGSTTQLAIEAAGVASAYNFKQVLRGGHVLGKKKHDLKEGVKLLKSKGLRNSRSRSHIKNQKYIRTEGIFVDEWLSLFAEGLQLGQKSDEAIKAMMGVRTPSMKRRHFSDDDTVNASNINNNTSNGKGTSGKIHDPFLCGLLLCLGFSEPLATKTETFDIEMLESARKISSLLGDDLRIILDLKSRRVPHRVWARLIDTLNSKRLVVEGIGSFDLNEVRRIEDIVSSPLCSIMFFHSAGDLQRACHENKIKQGDVVYFNAGSLMWKKESMCQPTSVVNCCQIDSHKSGRTPWIDYTFSETDDDLPMFQPFAYPHNTVGMRNEAGDGDSLILEDYQKRFDLNIGLYVQEYAIGPDEIDSLVQFINNHPSLYSLGLAWGCLNGHTCSNTTGDGYSSQRYMGSEWTYNMSSLGYNDIEPMPGFCSSLMIN